MSRRTVLKLRCAPALAGICLALLLIACAAECVGGGSTTTTIPGTPAGTYTLSVSDIGRSNTQHICHADGELNRLEVRVCNDRRLLRAQATPCFSIIRCRWHHSRADAYHATPCWLGEAPAFYAVGGGPTAAVAIADLNGDGIPDLAVATQSSGFAIFPGNGDGTFGTILRFAMGELFSYATLAVADLNGDGRPDIVVGRLAAGRDRDFLSVLINNSSGTSMAPLKNGNGTRSANASLDRRPPPVGSQS